MKIGFKQHSRKNIRDTHISCVCAQLFIKTLKKFMPLYTFLLLSPQTPRADMGLSKFDTVLQFRWKHKMQLNLELDYPSYWLVLLKTRNLHCVKRVRIRSYSGPHFSWIFPHSDWLDRDTPYLSAFSQNAGKSGKNADQNNSKYGLFLRRVGSRWMSIERKSFWTLRVINECYVYCFSLRWSINSWNNCCIWNELL